MVRRTNLVSFFNRRLHLISPDKSLEKKFIEVMELRFLTWFRSDKINAK